MTRAYSSTDSILGRSPSWRALRGGHWDLCYGSLNGRAFTVWTRGTSCILPTPEPAWKLAYQHARCDGYETLNLGDRTLNDTFLSTLVLLLILCGLLAWAYIGISIFISV